MLCVIECCSRLLFLTGQSYCTKSLQPPFPSYSSPPQIPQGFIRRDPLSQLLHYQGLSQIHYSVCLFVGVLSSLKQPVGWLLRGRGSSFLLLGFNLGPSALAKPYFDLTLPYTTYYTCSRADVPVQLKVRLNMITSIQLSKHIYVC